MPELPEAETIVRTLRPLISGMVIRGARFPGKRVLRSEMPQLEGRRVRAVSRYGKQVVVELNHGYLLVRLGMTGAMLVNQAAGKFTRAEFELDRATLHFDDVRQFGWIEYLDSPPEHAGPDPLEIGAEAFAERLRARRTDIKRLLLDQSFLRGVGNIYADEALFRAGIHPKAATQRLKRERAEHLHGQLQALLRVAIERGGSSISDYVDATGAKGSFQNLHLVYGREGEPCTQCGGAIQRIVLAQRGTHFCGTCQRK